LGTHLKHGANHASFTSIKSNFKKAIVKVKIIENIFYSLDEEMKKGMTMFLKLAAQL
jgi:hypothetical protein